MKPEAKKTLSKIYHKYKHKTYLCGYPRIDLPFPHKTSLISRKTPKIFDFTHSQDQSENSLMVCSANALIDKFPYLTNDG
jgi:hypothetical protein